MAVTWPPGIRSAGVAAGIKGGDVPDLGMIAFDSPRPWAGTFTRSAAAAAPVLWSRALAGRPLRALVVNSGNANACTGAAGRAAAAATARAAAAVLGCAPEAVALASTGPIGVQLPVEKLVHGIPLAVRGLSPDSAAFADAILTTDTRRKTSEARGRAVRVAGVAKGAAMLAPNMATMLAFLATDAAAPCEVLQRVLTAAVRTSFDRIDVDGCQSTNDSVFLLSSGTAGPVDEDELRACVSEVCGDLAEQIVRDAEGGSRLVRVQVAGALDETAAVGLARAVAQSALWRAAVHGGDPNWGRVVAALGAADPGLDLGALELSIGPEIVFAAGEPAGSPAAAARAMDRDEVTVVCRVGDGAAAAQVLTADLSPEYVELNAGGMS
jgi:glutamate N-acetyltransferase/amino-acid N-acetyltransferase